MGLNCMELAEESAVSVIPAQARSLCSSVTIKRPIDSNSVHGSGTLCGNNNNIQSLTPSPSKTFVV